MNEPEEKPKEVTKEEPFDPLELEIESSCSAFYVNKYRERSQDLKRKGMETLSAPVKKLMALSVDVLSRAIVEWKTKAEKAPGRKAHAYKFIVALEPDVLSLLTLREIMNRVSESRRYQSIAVGVASALQNELRLQAFQLQNPGAYKTVEEHIEESPLRGQHDYRPRVLLHAAKRYGIVWDKWSSQDSLQVGGLLLDLAISSTGFFELERVRSRLSMKNNAIMVRPTEALMKVLEEMHTKASVLHPPTLPMVAKPLEYTTAKNGGYYLPPLRRPLVKTKDHKTMMSMTPESSPVVFKAVNILQSVPWRVKARVLDALVNLWDVSGSVPGAAFRDDIPLPPAPIHPSEEESIRHKITCREIRYSNTENRGKRLSLLQTIGIASRFRENTLYFPYQLDFRSRMYVRPSFLSPQGSDVAKGLLEFAEGEPIGDDGARWLMIHTANCFGVDKVSLDDRVKWVKENQQRIIETATDPVGTRWWHDADQPVRFLAACIDLEGYWREGQGFITHVPVAVDGSCNGCQHLAAMTRDRQTGTYVNLVEADKPADLYAAVAKKATEIMENEKDPEKISWATRWVAFGITRSATKRPMMIVPYGGTISAFNQYLWDWVTEETKKGRSTGFDRKEMNKAVGYLAACVWEAVDEVVTGPRKLMRWTRAAAKVFNKELRPISWVTPSGFRVTMAYPEVSHRRVKTRCGDKILKLVMNQTSDKLNTRRQSSAFAPNWIHSYDAAVAQLTCCDLYDAGVRAISMNHDEYATLAPRVATMNRETRQVFSRVYQRDVLADFKDQLQAQVQGEIPSPPEYGDLDPTEVVRALYFFA